MICLDSKPMSIQKLMEPNRASFFKLEYFLSASCKRPKCIQWGVQFHSSSCAIAWHPLQNRKHPLQGLVPSGGQIVPVDQWTGAALWLCQTQFVVVRATLTLILSLRAGVGVLRLATSGKKPW